MPSILDSLYRCAEQHPDRPLYRFLGRAGDIRESYTYGEFIERTTDIAIHIQRTSPMAPGERVLLAYPPGLEMICAFFACVRLGLIPVPVYPPTTQGFKASLYKMNFIAIDCDAAAILTSRSYYWSMKLNRTRDQLSSFSFRKDRTALMTWIMSTDAETHRSETLQEGHSDILFLQYTSGSTNEPKGVMVTHENILANCEAVVDHLPIGVSWLPQYHDMGLIGYYLFFALKGGTTYGFSPLDFIERPALWLETISRFGGTASSAPNFAYEYCLRPDKIPPETFENLDLSSLRFLMTAAEPVRSNIYRDFMDRFEPYGLKRESFFSAYGLAEFTLAVTNYGRSIGSFDSAKLKENQAQWVDEGEETGDTTQLVSCGRPLGGAQITIADVSGQPKALPDGEVGEIWLRGPSKCAGYWRRPELTRSTFRARLEGDPAGDYSWLRSGDLGFLHDGELYICGRTKDLIIVRGLNYYPQDVEVIVEESRAVRRGCVTAFAWDQDGREQLVVVAELRDPKKLPETRELNQRIRQRLGISADRFVFIPARTTPKTSSGKLVRHQTATLWREGALRTLAEVDTSGTHEALHPGDPVSTESPDPMSGSESTNPGELSLLFRRYGLRGDETETLGDAGLDSIRIAEFAHDLKLLLESQGNEASARAVDLRFLMQIAISELFELLDQLANTAPLAHARFKGALERLRVEHGRQESLMMREDTALRVDVGPMLTNVSAHHESDQGDVLLTGGTGFFGPFLLKSLLEQIPGPIYVLVRATDERRGLERLRDGVLAIGGLDGKETQEWADRIRPVCGDLTRANLGLSETQWRALAGRIGTIYHNGAMVNYLFDYTTMRDANVGGTHEIVRLALTERSKVLNHVSTTFVFGWSVKETLLETDTNPEMAHLDFGYSQSKWVSEQIVHNAMKEGLRGRIFRPALLSPSIQGAGSSFDISIRLLAFILKHGIGTHAQNQVSFSPADLAANNIVAVSCTPASLGSTFHVTRDTYATLGDVTRLLGELTGRTFEELSLEDFVPEVIDRCTTDDLLFPLLNFLVRSVDNITAMEFKRYDNSNFQSARELAPHGQADPSLREVVQGILRFMSAHGIVDGPDGGS
jgi:thioester reductase-like protein